MSRSRFLMEMNSPTRSERLETIDFLRGVVMIVMALDHVRMYFGLGTWYAEPTNLATTTPLLFFTRWITHFCASTFVFLAGTSAFLYGLKRDDIRETASFLLRRGLWLIVVEVIIVNLAWTFDLTYSFLILQVIWAIGCSMIVLSVLVFLPMSLVLAVGLLLVFGHNLLDPITVQGSSIQELVWYALHQPTLTLTGSGRLVNFVYPVLPWTGLMVLGYVSGTFYREGVGVERRRRWLFILGLGMTLLFLVLRLGSLYGEPQDWRPQGSALFTLMSFLNTTKYPPSLQFLLMTMGPALMLLAAIETLADRLPRPVITLGRVPFFFYVVHLYLIHGLAMLFLVSEGRPTSEYILSASGIRSGRLIDFGVGLGGVYIVWVLVILLLYPLCGWYQRYRESHPSHWWLRYL
ncbi:MAG TPA: heparan-alpha-glucosaminide N-acetyltransferase domain-containing protein [Anaerolineales bacterium]|nr:heparan-alpha-glucosaminide N-acetyltransferase domain-containing protein [Anaerolineales bacterium]